MLLTFGTAYGNKPSTLELSGQMPQNVDALSTTQRQFYTNQR